MTHLIDYLKLTKAKFWELVEKDGETAKERFLALWKQMDERLPTQEEAIQGLNDLFLYTHLRIKQHSKSLASVYPTVQYTKNKLNANPELWWVDHYTAGISQWSTLSWFSAAKTKNGRTASGLAGASTHFVIGYHGEPFYIIPLMHGAWHEPRRNKDGLSVEMVNAGGLRRNSQGTWAYYARELPQELIEELPPVLLDVPYKNVTAMQPFTRDQIVNNIKLKRLVRMALNVKDLPERLEPCRMSQHSDWRESKYDMGPLWPFAECNEAAFSYEPIPELEVVQQYDKFQDFIGTIWEGDTTEVEDGGENPEYGEKEPTHDSDVDKTDGSKILSTRQIQSLLVKKGFSLTVDGIYGKQTHAAIQEFQQKWNYRNQPKLKVDGIAGPRTCECLKKEVQL